MYFEQIPTPGLGCYSYVIGCPEAGVMLVVDPRRDTGIYLSTAEEKGMRITHIFDTHVHADHISGAQQLRAETGANIYMHESAQVKYQAKKVKDGDEFILGNVFARILHTPGHTPNSISLIVSDLARSTEPEMILTGDLLFVGDIGRPDLPGEEILDEQIVNLFDSLHKTLGQLPDYLEVYPGHGQGSLCGQGMSAKPNTTLGYERLCNPMMQYRDFEEFRKAILSNLPVRPQSFSAIIPGNMELVSLIPFCEDLSEYALSVDKTDELRNKGVTLLDLRDAISFSAAHIPGSIHVDASVSTMLNWIGMVIPPAAQLVLILPCDRSFEEMRLELLRIGYDDAIIGWLKGGLDAWLSSGKETKSIPLLSAAELRNRMAESDPPIVIDVRGLAEFSEVSIEGSVNVPFATVLEDDSCTDQIKKKAVIVCASGFRSSIAASILQAGGCVDISVLYGGISAWENS